MNDVGKCGKQLKVKLKFEQECVDCQRTIGKVLLLNSKEMLLVDLQQIVHARAKCFDVYPNDDVFLLGLGPTILWALVTKIIGIADIGKLLGIELVGTKCKLEGKLRIYSAIVLYESLNLFEECAKLN